MSALWYLPLGILVVGTALVLALARRTTRLVREATASARTFTDDLRLGTTALRSEMDVAGAGVRSLRRRLSR